MPWIAALDDFGPSGQVLELACGPGTWTSQLLSHADTVTAVDAAPEMLQIAAAKVRDNRPVSGCQGTAHPDV
jgi:demethylmenaquinone methyltransferase/2-methoxy-6-polyprenyl-1,4-benzoquinol methylase